MHAVNRKIVHLFIERNYMTAFKKIFGLCELRPSNSCRLSALLPRGQNGQVQWCCTKKRTSMAWMISGQIPSSSKADMHLQAAPERPHKTGCSEPSSSSGGKKATHCSTIRLRLMVIFRNVACLRRAQTDD